MKRSDFLKIIGAGALITATGLPAIAGAEPKELDYFYYIRKLIAERAQPDWEIAYTVTKEEGWGHQYTVHIFQNENYHRESSIHKNPEDFNEKAQTNMFQRLIYGVDQFNALPEENQQAIKDLMKTIR